jgi:hypothetical protein
MTELLKKGVKFSRNENCDEAFHTLRAHLTTTPVLAQPDTPNLLMFAVMHQAPDLDVYLCKIIE